MERRERVPQTGLAGSFLARAILRVLGWTLVDETPDEPRWVLVAAPHTSNWDAFLMVTVAIAIRVRLAFLVKRSLPFPIGWLARRMGGVLIDRGAGNVVNQVVAEFGRRPTLVLGVAPEGTRRRTEHWKTGFYYIALRAGVPLHFGYLDYGRKEAGCRPGLTPTGDIHADFARIRAFYEGMTGRYPDQFTNATVRPGFEAIRSGDPPG